MNVREGAILGFGQVAAHGHVAAWHARPDARIVAIADIDPARRALAQAMVPDARVYENATALLARERVDFVDIATPPGGHAELILQAMHAGCDVLCEKPLVTTLDDFYRVARWARRTNLALVTVHNWKHSIQFKQLTELVVDGAVGSPTCIQLEADRNGQAASVGQSWRGDALQAGGGILFDHGWHSLYLALALARERPHSIHAVIERRRLDLGEVEDTAHCRVELPSSTAELALTWAAERRRTRWRVTGAIGSIDLEEDRLQARTTDRTHNARFPDSISASSHHPDWFDAVIDDFFHAIDDPTARYGNLVEAEWCLTLITLAYQSAASGKPVPIPPGMPSLTWAQRPRPAKPRSIEGAVPAAPQR